MLRRKQIMMSDWLDDFIQEICKKYNVSYSEAVRVMLSYGFAQVLCKIYPEYNFSIDADRMASASRELNDGKIDIEANQKLTADIYFEARRILDDCVKKMKASQKSSETTST